MQNEATPDASPQPKPSASPREPESAQSKIERLKPVLWTLAILGSAAVAVYVLWWVGVFDASASR